MTSLLIASRNSHKVQEVRAILGQGFHYLTLNDFPNAPKIIEDAGTFAGNATKKAVELARWLARRWTAEQGTRKADEESLPSKLHVLADDSGLEVDALNGAPGAYSARFAAMNGRAGGPPAGPAGTGNAPDADNNARLLHLLKDVALEKRTARFRCVVALTPVLPVMQQGASPVCYADELELETELFEGMCEGHVGFAPRGAGGFGYDPLFIPEGYQQSFAELGAGVKNGLSHRARALARLRERLLG